LGTTLGRSRCLKSPITPAPHLLANTRTPQWDHP
jgi:hypothetical protein